MTLSEEDGSPGCLTGSACYLVLRGWSRFSSWSHFLRASSSRLDILSFDNIITAHYEQ